jgi:hypothetical protein
MRTLITVTLSVLLTLVSGCTDQDSNFDEIQGLTGHEREETFRSYSLEERFRLYNKVYENSGHPHDVELATSFRDEPERSLEFIIEDLKTSNFTDFLRYLPIIYDVGKRSGTNICQPRYIGRLKAIISNYDLSAAQRGALKGLQFDGCELP